VAFEDLSFHCVTVDPERVIEVASAASIHNETFDEIVRGVTGIFVAYCTIPLDANCEVPTDVVTFRVK
jgi:hypothetical protein